MIEYVAAGGFILGQTNYTIGPLQSEPLCTVPEAAHAYVHLQKGPAICRDRGHDYSMRVPQTSNMYLCFRCGEPGWEVPVWEPQSTEAPA